MKYSIELLKSDIRDELHKLSLIKDELNDVAFKLDMKAEDVAAYDRGAIGYFIHNFYNGCENIFQNISRFFENDLEDSRWHKDLLKRMTLEIPGYRPRVIGKELFLLLDDQRAFRHKFRHSYSFELDWYKEQMVAKKLPKAYQLLNEQVIQFLNQLDEI